MGGSSLTRPKTRQTSDRAWPADLMIEFGADVNDMEKIQLKRADEEC